MNIFSQDDFLDVFGRAYFPGQQMTPQLFELEGRFWRLPCINSGNPISGSTFIDFFEPLDGEVTGSQPSPKRVRYLSRACHGIVCCSDWIARDLHLMFQPSPTIFWSEFESWDAFTSHARRKESRLFSDARRRQRKLEKELGPLQYVLDDRRPKVLESCFRWKSQYLCSRALPDSFSNSTHLSFLRELAGRQIVFVSSLSAGDHLLAVSINMVENGRLYFWVTTYDPARTQYAPGRLLLHSLLEESFRQQHTEFDFLLGGEGYKWNYATRVRLVADLGRRPLPEQVKYWLRRALRQLPGLN